MYIPIAYAKHSVKSDINRCPVFIDAAIGFGSECLDPVGRETIRIDKRIRASEVVPEASNDVGNVGHLQEDGDHTRSA